MVVLNDFGFINKFFKFPSFDLRSASVPNYVIGVFVL